MRKESFFVMLMSLAKRTNTQSSIWDICDNICDNLFDTCFVSPMFAHVNHERYADALVDADGNNTITLILPGVKREFIDVRVNEGLLTIELDANCEPHMKNRQFCYQLLCDHDETAISAKHVDGVLTITIPQKKSVKSSHKIDIT